MEWIYFTEDLKKCTISWFDDGNKKYEHFDNLWYIIATNNQGKYRLKNTLRPEVVINSISNWKTTMC